MIYLFNNNEELIRIVPKTAIRSLYQSQKLTDENYISDRLDVEMGALDEEILSELEYMAIDDVENPQRFHYYFISNESTENNITTLIGVQSGIEELRKTPVYDIRPNDQTPKTIADRLLEGTNWQTGFTTNEVGTLSTNFYYTDVFSALKKMCMAFGIEMQFFVEITTNRIGARYIEFRKKTGKNAGKRVVYGHNALQIVKEVEKTNTYTALIGRGKGVEVSSAEDNDSGQAGFGRKIGIEDVDWRISSGAPVDKPKGQEYLEIPALTLQYGIKNSNGTVRPKIGFVEFQDEEDPYRLIDKTYEALLEQGRPQVLLKTSSTYLPDTGIGDTVNVVRHDRNLRYQTRVFEITWDRLVNKAVTMKLGDRLNESENKRISRISNQVSNNISGELGSTIDIILDRLTTADGKNTNWYTDYDPATNPDTMGLVRVNDNWFAHDPEQEGEYILYRWDGEMWIEILRTSGMYILEEALKQAEELAEELRKEIEESDKKAANAVSKAEESLEKIGTINTTITDLRNDLKDTDAIAKGVKSSFETFETGFSASVKDLIGNYSQQGQTINGLFSEVYSADGRVSQAIQTVNGFKQTVEDLESGTGTVFEQLVNGARLSVEQGELFSGFSQSLQAMEAKVTDGDTLAQLILGTDVFQTEISKFGTSPNLFSESMIVSGLQTSTSQPNTIYQYDNGWYAALEIDPTKKYSISGRSGLRAWGFTEDKPDVLVPVLNKVIHSASGTENVTPPENAKYLYMEFGTSNAKPFTSRIQVEEGPEITDYQPSLGDNTSIRSAFTQQVDSISLGLFGVSDMFSGVNIEESGVRLKGKIIHLDGLSKIDDAVIKNAMIDTVSANKLTAGTIDASQINVINLDANNITANMGTFIKVALKDANSDMTLDGNKLTIDSRKGWDMNLRNYGLTFNASSGSQIGIISAYRNLSTNAPLGVWLAANSGQRATLAYQGSNSTESLEFSTALFVDGTTGDITTYSNIFGATASSSSGIKLGTTLVNNDRVTTLTAVDKNGNELGAIAIGAYNLRYKTSSSGWRNLNNALP